MLQYMCVRDYVYVRVFCVCAKCVRCITDTRWMCSLLPFLVIFAGLSVMHKNGLHWVNCGQPNVSVHHVSCVIIMDDAPNATVAEVEATPA